MLNRLVFLFLFLFLFSPVNVFGDVFINEIMYDLPGSDSKREWIEIYNSGSGSINLEGLNIQTTSNHRPFTLLQGSFELGPGQYALIIQDYESFLNDWPGFSGTLFESAFNLRNETETVVLKRGEEIIDSISYFSEWGAEGDGNTLQRFEEVWKSMPPTPGFLNLFVFQESSLSQNSSEQISLADKPEEQELVRPGVEKEVEVEGESVQTEDLAYNLAASGEAQVLSALPKEENDNLFKWAIALFILLLIASVSIFLSPKKEAVDEIKIIE